MLDYVPRYENIEHGWLVPNRCPPFRRIVNSLKGVPYEARRELCRVYRGHTSFMRGGIIPIISLDAALGLALNDYPGFKNVSAVNPRLVQKMCRTVVDDWGRRRG